MSRSNNTEIRNPALKFYSWDGEKGGFRYYDKDKKERIKDDLPFRFMVLDCLSTIRGFNDHEQSGYWSNEVRDIKRDILTVKSESGIMAKGIYKDVIANRNCNGAKYCQSVYVAIREGESLYIANLQLTGASLSSWIEFRKKNKVFDGAIEVAKMVEGQKGKIIYKIPVFKKIGTTDKSDAQALQLDKELQEYLLTYFAHTNEKVSQLHSEEINPNDSYLPPNDEDYISAEETTVEATGELLNPVDGLPF